MIYRKRKNTHAKIHKYGSKKICQKQNRHNQDREGPQNICYKNVLNHKDICWKQVNECKVWVLVKNIVQLWPDVPATNKFKTNTRPRRWTQKVELNSKMMSNERTKTKQINKRWEKFKTNLKWLSCVDQRTFLNEDRFNRYVFI